LGHLAPEFETPQLFKDRDFWDSLSKNIEQMNIMLTRFSNDEMMSTKSNKTLTTLIMINNGISDLAAKVIGDLLSENKTLLKLNISRNTITDIGIKCIANGLCNNQALTYLNVNDNRIAGQGLSLLLQTLTILHMNYNDITDQNLIHNRRRNFGAQYNVDLFEIKSVITGAAE
ncbi:unnamed protein product, partial [Didymodactylos carnosus]